MNIFILDNNPIKAAQLQCDKHVVKMINYIWHYDHFMSLCYEYQYRYGKVHSTQTRLEEVLSIPPRNIPQDGLTPFRLAMGVAPECIDESNPVISYRKFYQTKQARFKMAWTKREVPDWFKELFV